MDYISEIGLRRLNEMRLAVRKQRVRFSLAELGAASLRRLPILIVLLNGAWEFVAYSKENVKRYCGHGCIYMKGKRWHYVEYAHRSGSIADQMKAYEGEEWEEVRDIFNACKGLRMQKKSHGSRGCGTRPFIGTKRFANSHVTVAYRGRA